MSYSRNLLAIAVWLSPNFLANWRVLGYAGYSFLKRSASYFLTAASSVPSKSCSKYPCSRV